jgi:hypothetical protein
VAESRLRYDAERAEVELVSEASEGRYASRRRGWWRRRGVVLAGTGDEDAHDPQHEAEPWPALQAN